jgi:hypothetical protein
VTALHVITGATAQTRYSIRSSLPSCFFLFRTVSHLCLFLPPLRPGPHSCYGLGLGCDSGKLLPAGAFVKATPPSACCATCCYWRCVCGHRRSPRNQPARGSCLRPSCCSGSQAAVGPARPHPTCSPRGPAPRRAAVAVARWRWAYGKCRPADRPAAGPCRAPQNRAVTAPTPPLESRS